MLIQLLRRYLRPYRHLLAGVLVLQTIQVVASLYLPNLNADIINKGVAQADVDYIWRGGGFMLAVSVLQGIASVGATWMAARSALGAGRDIRADIFERVGDFSEKEVSAFGPGSLITRTTNDVQQVQMLIMMSCTVLVSAPLLAIGGIAMAVGHAPSLSWLVAIAAPVMIVLMLAVVARMVPLFRSYQEKLDTINRVIREQLSGIRVVRAFVREEAETERFAQANDDISRVGLAVGNLFVFLFPVALMVVDVTMAGVIWFGGHGVQDGTVEVGTLVAFMAYLMQILMGIVMASFMSMMVPRAAVCAERIEEVLATSPDMVIAQDPVSHFPTPGSIELRNVAFSYPGAQSAVLSDITVSVAPGQSVAIVGSTGAGKTTLINLMTRLIDATSGEVIIGGVNVTDADPQALWAQMGFVPQKPFLFKGTIASNLRLGAPEATDEELWEALEVAQAADFVREMTDQLDAPIAQGGTNVSGGQRQRLSIARALVRRPAMLLFDDSFSALDVATDARLRAALRSTTQGVTKVVVAQRVSTITDADIIMVIDNGHLVGCGTHDELLVSNETYREIVSSQMQMEESR